MNKEEKEKLFHIVFFCWNKWKKHDEQEGTRLTWCNKFVDEVCKQYGYKGFKGLLANQIHKKLLKDTAHWIYLDPEGHEMLHTENGELVIASRPARGHGHVCVLLPGKHYSGKWKKWVPRCANIGGTNFWDRGTSYAFRNPPKYFLYRGEL